MDLSQAQAQVNPIYDPAVANIQAQIPAVQQLYGALLQGLQAQNQNQAGIIAQSAAQRGVGSQGINAGAQQAFAGTLAQQGAQLGVQNAQNVGGLSQEVGRANVGRGQATIAMGNSLQDQSLEAQKNQQNLTNLERDYALKQQQNQQNYNVQEASYRTAQARANAAAAKAANDAASKLELGQFTSTLEASLNKMTGGDGKVSPDTWNKALTLWTSKGLPASEFINSYVKYVNKSHIQDYFKR